MIMKFEELIRRRRMTRAFTPEPVESAVVDRMVDAARRGPSAGNTASIEFLVLEGVEQTARYWDTTLPVEQRSMFPWPELLHAHVLIVPWVDPAAYVRRYDEPDKTSTGLGASTHAWSVPYWFVDGGAAAMTLLLAAENEGLGALLFGLFDHEDAVRITFGVPMGLRALGAIAIGHRAPDRPSQSAGRTRRPLEKIVHRGRW
ncbi:MAG: nitroreductase family protein [Acidimicrobiaceae bacterium]|nr:nitroreductase family protein [Acidimicrobiaceae bacterium]MBT5851288.1 nitroreductase family protein [Acidimicrobiaceae bacterium]